MRKGPLTQAPCLGFPQVLPGGQPKGRRPELLLPPSVPSFHQLSFLEPAPLHSILAGTFLVQASPAHYCNLPGPRSSRLCPIAREALPCPPSAAFGIFLVVARSPRPQMSDSSPHAPLKEHLAGTALKSLRGRFTTLQACG